MNPLTNMKNVTKLSERELQNNSKSSWHDQYRDSAWIFIGGLPYELTEGDIICIFSQYGEIVNINLIRDKDNGKSKGFCFLCYEDQRSTILAVDNLNGIKVLKRIIRVDHVSEYKIPKEGKKTGEETKKLYNEGCAPKAVVPIVKKVIENPEYRRETLADQIQADIKLPARLPIRIDIKKEIDSEELIQPKTEQVKKEKKKSRKYSDAEDSDSESKRRKKKKKSHKKQNSSSESDTNSENKFDSQKKNLDRKIGSLGKLKNDEKGMRRRERSRNRENGKRSRSRSYERKRERSRSRNRVGKISKEKHSHVDRNQHEKYKRRSRSR
ncbi:U2 snRNP component ist3 [Coccinella septempunctata]|uniref:U2 snRNP component ist3 n=1 Tax=Coccinella septempunctata TaxID=41139 RepID=UPI001D05EE86|nr:U2 snRNP component ist3 [Coccinella septempunctata]